MRPAARNADQAGEHRLHDGKLPRRSPREGRVALGAANEAALRDVEPYGLAGVLPRHHEEVRVHRRDGPRVGRRLGKLPDQVLVAPDLVVAQGRLEAELGPAPFDAHDLHDPWHARVNQALVVTPGATGVGCARATAPHRSAASNGRSHLPRRRADRRGSFDHISALHPRQGDPLDEVALGQEEDHHDGQRHQGAGGHHHAPFAPMLTAELEEPQRERR